MLEPRLVEVRHFQWPRRPTSTAVTRLLGVDEHGRWMGVAEGDPWCWPDGTSAGTFVAPLVKVVPSGTFWTACFHPTGWVVDVDIVLPVQWVGDAAYEEVDLELDVQRSADGTVRVKDRDVFERVRAAWPMPDEVVARAEEACAWAREMVERREEPFGQVGAGWLARFVAEVDAAR